MNQDAFSNLPVGEAARASMHLVDALQNHRREAQPHATAAVFVLLCERFRLNPQEIMTKTKNLMAHAEGRPEFLAIAEYMAKEL